MTTETWQQSLQRRGAKFNQDVFIAFCEQTANEMDEIDYQTFGVSGHIWVFITLINQENFYDNVALNESVPKEPTEITNSSFTSKMRKQGWYTRVHVRKRTLEQYRGDHPHDMIVMGAESIGVEMCIRFSSRRP
jgi:hypothetical protein